MDKTCSSSSSSPEQDPAPPNPNPNPNHFQYLNQLNKISHKISKPPIRKPSSSSSSSSFDHQTLLLDDHQLPPPHQPPVYNINKNDFRDVVQKLTGSPSHDNNKLSTPAAAPAPAPSPPKPPSSRLHRIRPPPLEHISNRPLPLLNSTGFFSGQRPLSPLPPLPSVHAAAESPISAYMRYFQSQPPAPNNFLLSPTTSGSVPAPTTSSSPVPFGCLPSPRSPYQVLSSSPGSLFSAVNQFGFPLSPTPAVRSPRWKSH